MNKFQKFLLYILLDCRTQFSNWWEEEGTVKNGGKVACTSDEGSSSSSSSSRGTTKQGMEIQCLPAEKLN